MGISENPYEAPAAKLQETSAKVRKPLWVRLLCSMVAVSLGLHGGLLLIVLAYFELVPYTTGRLVSEDPILEQRFIVFQVGPISVAGGWQGISLGVALLLLAVWLLVWAFRSHESEDQE